jgi:hypothetical protein
MRLVEPVEYTLYLNTGERIEVLELDAERIEALRIPEITMALSKLLSLCNSITRLAVEEAKRGYSDKLESQLRTSPVAALLKIDKPKCVEFRQCPAVKKLNCDTTKIADSRKKLLPICWEYSVSEELTGVNRVMAVDLARHIVHAWSHRMYILTITG